MRKPAYRVPTMREVARTKRNGLVVASTFSGAGGSCLGWKMAGFRVAWANENDGHAQECYARNFPDTVLDRRDVRNVTAADVLKVLKMRPGQLDVLEGSPPCFAAGTKVVTKRGNVSIEKVRVGDSVMTHRARWRKVVRTMRRKAQTVTFDYAVECTGDHRFYSREMNWTGGSWKYTEPRWLPASDVRGNLVAFPKCLPWTSGKHSRCMGKLRWHRTEGVTAPARRKVMVFDLTVDADESFTLAAGYVVHNCQGFSMAGKRKVTDRRNDLFSQFVRLLRGLKPKAFTAENVKGMVMGSSIGIARQVMRELERSGYRVKARIVDAQWLGVPQARERVIFVGVREDLRKDPPFPRPMKYRYSMAEAIGIGEMRQKAFGEKRNRGGKDAVMTINSSRGGTLPKVKVLRGSFGSAQGRVWAEPDGPSIAVTASNQAELKVLNRTGRLRAPESMDGKLARTVTANSHGQWKVVGRKWQGKPPEVKVKYTAGRDKGEENVIAGPSPTVAALGLADKFATATKVQDGEAWRNLTIAEVKRICSFPDDYIMEGSFSDQWARLGNSVPPLMMFAIAREVAKEIFGR